MRCPHWDCGWCYYEGDLKTNDKQGACQGNLNCVVCQNEENKRLRKIIEAQDEELDEAKRDVNRLTRKLNHIN